MQEYLMKSLSHFSIYLLIRKAKLEQPRSDTILLLIQKLLALMDE